MRHDCNVILLFTVPALSSILCSVSEDMNSF